MVTSLNVEVTPLSRVEGHGEMIIDVKNKKIVKAQFRIPEPPRFFEAFLVGRKYDEPSHITSRICGICGVSHTCASIKATEKAMGITPSDQTVNLRKLIFYHEVVQSNALHFYYLSLPDFFKTGSIFSLAADYPDLVKVAVNIKKTANDIVRIIGGRAVHPIRPIIGGFTKLPTEEELVKIKKMLKAVYPGLEKTLKILKKVKVPDFERETEYISISNPKEYAIYSGNIKSTDGWEIEDQDYLDRISEKIVDYSTGKHARASRESNMVGALARVNNNYKLLSNNAKGYAAKLGLKPICYNPFMNNIAQFVEIVHCVDDSFRLIDTLLENGLDENEAVSEVKIRAGRGVGIVEAPRGILIHDYTYDNEGRITKVNLIIPTNHNYGNIKYDLEKFIPEILNETEEKVRFDCEMLIRAYDPCISCSTHLLDLKLINK